MTSPLHCPPLLVALALAWPLVATAQTAAPTTLTPPTQRVTDAAIDADHQAYERLQSRIKGLNEGGRPVRDHHLAKAQCWLDVSFHEYSRNDRSAFPQAALAQSETLIAAMERGASPLPMDTPLVNDAERLRPDLWARALALRSHAGWRCAQAKAACGEVELVHAGNEHKQLQWRHAKPYVQIAEDLIGEAEALAASCLPPAAPVVVAAVAPVVIPATVTVAPPPPAPPAPPTAPPKPVLVAVVLPVTLSAQVVFSFDRHAPTDMRAYSVQQLDGALAQVRSQGLVLQAVRLVGHADRLNGTGQSDYNRRLSERRAATVREHLQQRGIGAGLIQIDARGDAQQVEGCSTAKLKPAELQECLLPNRRVEVQLIGVRP